MAWTYFPVSAGDTFTEQDIWQELIDAINERCTWAGIAGLSNPGNPFFTAANFLTIEQKIEELVPYFANPAAVVSSGNVTISNWNWQGASPNNIANTFIRGDWYRTYRLANGNYFTQAGNASVGDVAMENINRYYTILDLLRWNVASGVGSNSFQYVDGEHRSYYEYEYPSGVWNSTGGLTESDWTTSGVVTPSIDEGNIRDLGTLSVFEKVGNYSAQVVEVRSKIKVSDLPSGLDKKSATFHFLNSEHFYYANDHLFPTGYEFSVASFSIDNPSSSGTMTSSDYFGAPLGFSIQQGYDNIPPSGVWSQSQRKYVQQRIDFWTDWPSGNVSSVQTLIEINFDKLT